VHVIWIEELVRERIVGLYRAADRTRRIRHIARQPDHCGVLLAVPSARPLSGHPRPAGVDAPVAGPLEVVWFHGQPGGADGCGQRRM
jgi:hypothetical protein